MVFQKLYPYYSGCIAFGIMDVVVQVQVSFVLMFFPSRAFHEFNKLSEWLQPS